MWGDQTVGGGLLPMRACQLITLWMTHCYRDPPLPHLSGGIGFIQRLVYQQLYAFQHSAYTQRYVARGTVDLKGQVGGYIADGSQVLRGVD